MIRPCIRISSACFGILGMLLLGAAAALAQEDAGSSPETMRTTATSITVETPPDAPPADAAPSTSSSTEDSNQMTHPAVLRAVFVLIVLLLFNLWLFMRNLRRRQRQ
ncbi:hypothetical protein JXA32_00710 [Candidatus Sumerlaeota bacterium]|nr:hypothetical protein [Candidatus Sumerlaeota bacterium]